MVVDYLKLTCNLYTQEIKMFLMWLILFQVTYITLPSTNHSYNASNMENLASIRQQLRK